MKAIAIGDIHAHKFPEWATIDDVTGNSRLTDTLSVFDQMRRHAIENKIGVIFCSGDVFHKRKAVDVETYNFVVEEIRKITKAGIKFIVVPGNHDQATNESLPEHSLEGFKDIEGVTVLDTFEPYEYNGYYIFPAPYSKDTEMVKEALDGYAQVTTNEGIENKSILLAHLGLSGAFVGKSNYAMADAFTVEDLFPHAFQFVICGHFHKNQDLGGHEHVFYTGAPTQHNFNDEGQDKGFWELDLEARTKTLIPSAAPKFLSFTVKDTSEIATLEKEFEGNFIRFKVDAEDVEQLIEAIPEDTKFRLDIQKEYSEDTRLDVDVSMSLTEVVKVYAKDKNPDALAIGLEILQEIE